jgi:ATP-dependent DNA helicase RecG
VTHRALWGAVFDFCYTARMALTLHSPVSAVPRVGPTFTKQLKALGILSVRDALWHLPFRYDDFSKDVAIDQIKAGETVTIRGQVEFIRSRRSFRKRLTITEALVSDTSGSIRAVWFNQPYLPTTLPPGTRVALSGRAEDGLPALQLTSPTYEKISPDMKHTGRLVPIYPAATGVSQRQLRSLIHACIPLAQQVEDMLPASVRSAARLLNIGQALHDIHFPDSETAMAAAQRRLAFDELFLFIMSALQTKKFLAANPAPAIPFLEVPTREFVQNLPFNLTKGQRKAAWEILGDLAKPSPMNRLLQGDVGFGKTVVSALAMLNAGLSGFQSALLAPTSILAEQHYRTLLVLFSGTDIRVALWTSARHEFDGKAVTKPALAKSLARGEITVVVGTHALLEPDVQFHRLGLAVVDEQHRFGVEQRQQLRKQASLDSQAVPHFLSLSATPIPRSLALTIYGDLDITTLRERPPGRADVITKIVSESQRDAVTTVMRRAIKAGHQVFVICPLITESDQLGVLAATETAQRLREGVFSDVQVGLIHGQLPAKLKTKAIEEFHNGRTNILVATPVVEVGIDIPNATVMVIEAAERFGLAQLHQLRGRIGRGSLPGTCFLMVSGDGKQDRHRLDAVMQSQDGFALAEADLKLRGPGALMGIRQSGLPDFRLAQLTDTALVTEVRKIANDVLKNDPYLEKASALREALHGFAQTHHPE